MSDFYDELEKKTEKHNKIAAKIYNMLAEEELTVDEVVDLCHKVEQLARKSTAQKYEGELNAFTVV